MFGLDSGVAIYVVAGITDMRKSYDSLAAIVEQELGLVSMSGALFVFCNRRRDRLKILHWDGSGLCLFAKRLEKGTFTWPKIGDSYTQFNDIELRCLVQGVDFTEPRKRKWFRKSLSPDGLDKQAV